MFRFLKKKWITGTLCLLLVAGGYFVFTAPDPEKILPHVLKNLGFDGVILPAPEQTWTGLTYHSIRLDPDGFSTIEKVHISHGLRGTIKSMEIEGLSLTGELLSGLQVNIAGWRKPDPAFLEKLTLPAQIRITFKDAEIALLSHEVGGISLSFDLQIRPGDDGHEFEARLDGAQKQLTYDASVTGVVTPEGIWQAGAEIGQAKFDLGPLKATRISGLINVTGDRFEESEIIGNLQAGGLSLLGLPWQNSAITLDGSFSQPRMITGAKSAGVEGLELGLSFENLRNLSSYNGSLHSDTPGVLLDYLQSNDMLPFVPPALSDPARQSSSMEAEFQGHKGAIVFKLAPRPETPELFFLIRPVDETLNLSAIGGGQPFIYERNAAESYDSATLILDPARRALMSVPPGRAIKIDLQNLKIRLE
ncbi:MAG: hypothetical protein IT559_00895 [Alphaproteobacteria bacterium]|nr:hypothetical protein [Alphaproteobacteria bacterium]